MNLLQFTQQVSAYIPSFSATIVYLYLDEDPKYKASELNAHGPTVRGWQSTKNCEYPQELILKLKKRCSLHKIQFLAHQYLIRELLYKTQKKLLHMKIVIASKIELYSSNEDTNTVTDVMQITWEYLGYITLSDNQSSSFKSRELKSAKVPTCTATFIKLKLGKNHSNSYNTYNQVFLYLFNVYIENKLRFIIV